MTRESLIVTCTCTSSLTFVLQFFIQCIYMYILLLHFLIIPFSRYTCIQCTCSVCIYTTVWSLLSSWICTCHVGVLRSSLEWWTRMTVNPIPPITIPGEAGHCTCSVRDIQCRNDNGKPGHQWVYNSRA